MQELIKKYLSSTPKWELTPNRWFLISRPCLTASRAISSSWMAREWKPMKVQLLWKKPLTSSKSNSQSENCHGHKVCLMDAGIIPWIMVQKEWWVTWAPTAMALSQESTDMERCLELRWKHRVWLRQSSWYHLSAHRRWRCGEQRPQNQHFQREVQGDGLLHWSPC